MPLTENLVEEKQQLKVRIFALAKELGMDSKVLIQHCNDAGIPVKASALASISPAERDVVLDFIKSKTSKAKPEASAIPRELPVDVAGKVRPIKTIPARPMVPTGRPSAPAKPEREVEPESETPPSSIPPAKVLEARLAPAAEEAPPPGGSEAPPQIAAEEEPAAPDISSQPAIRREDYLTPHGATPTKLREMRPIGSTGDMRTTGTVRKSKPNLPQLAAIPDAPVVKPKRDDRPAQKPDIKLSADFDSAGPLKGRVSQVIEGKKVPGSPRKRMLTVEEEEAERVKGKGPGGAFVGSREERRQRRHTRVEVPTDEA